MELGRQPLEQRSQKRDPTMSQPMPMSHLISRLAETYLGTMLWSLRPQWPQKEIQRGRSSCKYSMMGQMRSRETYKHSRLPKSLQHQSMLAKLRDKAKRAQAKQHIQRNQTQKRAKCPQMKDQVTAQPSFKVMT